MTPPSSATWRIRWPLYAGMSVAGAAAVVASASTLASLARTAGWSSWTPWLLPAAVDIGGSAGGWCWLRPGIPDRARNFGATVAIVSATASLIGNAAGHLLAAGYLSAGPVLVVIVGAIPAMVLVALAHLAALLGAQVQIDDDEQADPSVTTHPETADLEQESSGDTRTTVLQLLSEKPRTVSEVVQATGKARSTVNGHLTALTKNGAIARGADKRYWALHPLTAAPDSDSEGEQT